MSNDTFIGDGYVVQTGKYKDRCLGDIPLKELDGYLGYLDSLKYKKRETQELIKVLNNYFSDPVIKKELENQL